MKKIISILALSIIATLFITGCGKQSSSDNSDSTENTVIETTVVATTTVQTTTSAVTEEPTEPTEATVQSEKPTIAPPDNFDGTDEVDASQQTFIFTDGNGNPVAQRGDDFHSVAR